MPEITRFFGILITMYYREHVPPHFHAWYSGHRAEFDFVWKYFSWGNAVKTVKNDSSVGCNVCR